MNKKFKINIKALGILDLLAFKNLVPNRKKIFANGANTPINKMPAMNALANDIHPKEQTFVISDIKEITSEIKQYSLKSEHAAYFRAGQYISLKLNIDGHMITRPYSLSSAPKESLSGIYEISVKKSGFVSEYIFKNWKVGDTITTSAPQGNFYYEGIRDADTVVGIAGGCGITPFLSMAQAIVDGAEDFNLVLLYGSRTAEDIAFFEQLSDIEKLSDGKVKVIHVLSDVEKSGFEHGFITKELIEKYSGTDKYSIFMCGPQVMYKFVGKEIERLNLKRKYIRTELFGQINDAGKLESFPEGKAGKKVKMTLHMGGKTHIFDIMTNESILVGIERNKLVAPSRCRTGECGFCRSKLISGDVFIPIDTDGRRAADRKFGYIHICSTFALSDIEIDVPKPNKC